MMVASSDSTSSDEGFLFVLIALEHINVPVYGRDKVEGTSPQFTFIPLFS